MSSLRLLGAAAIIAGVLVISFIILAPHTHDIQAPTPSPAATSVPAVTLHDSYTKGLHTITGTVEAPNACAIVTADAALSEQTSQQSILVRISLSEDSSVCLQLPTAMDFLTTLSAPAHLPIEAVVNDSAASTTVL